jgi:hypothetical protein
MTTTQPTTPVAQPVEQLVESVITLGTSIVRLGASAIVIPLSILPLKERESTIQTAHKLLTSAEKINVSVLRVAGRVTTTWLNEIDKAIVAATPPPAPAATPVAIDPEPETK